VSGVGFGGDAGVEGLLRRRGRGWLERERGGGGGGGSVGGGEDEAVEIGGEGEIGIGVPGGSVGGGDERVHPVVGVEIGEAEGGRCGCGLRVREMEWWIGLEGVGEVGGMERVTESGGVVPWNWM